MTDRSDMTSVDGDASLQTVDSDGEGSVRVVGTAHVSAESVREVEAAIREDRPDVVAVELDEGRYRQLQGETPDDIEPSDLLEGNTVFQFIAYWMLSYVQAQLGEKFDVTPGAEMMAAVETAEELGVDVALVDRDIQTTIQRFWARMSALEKLRMVGGLVFGVTDPRIAGLTFGLFVGMILGPVIGLFGGTLGVTQGLLTSITGGVILAATTGYLLLKAGDALGLDENDGILLALGGGSAVGIVAGVGVGLLDPLVARFLGGFAVSAVGSLALGLAVGLLVGAVAGVVMDAFGVGSAEDDLEEFDVDELTDTDVVSMMMEEFREFSPGGAEALIDERDAYIAHELVRLREAGHDVVAVVGAGHQEGIERYLGNPGSLPPQRSLLGAAKKQGFPWMKAVGAAFSLGFLAFFLLLAMAGVRDGFLLRLFAAWFVVNGVLAGALAKAAGARWSSAAVGGGVAWMTSVNPLLAPGWFTGYMELRHTPVNVSDIATLNKLIADEERPLRDLLSDMLDVPLFRLIMVVAMTNIGSIVASLLFAAYILPLFAAELNGVEGVTRLMLQGAHRSADLVWRAIA